MPRSLPAIVSASRRTDIPAFYSRWFQNRLKEGWCEVRNPFSGQSFHVSLASDDVLGWVFWSRNYNPFLETLEHLHGMGQRFICHFTITGFPSILEAHNPPLTLSLATAGRMSARFGPESVVWRYDPVLLTSCTPPDWHVANFTGLAGDLEGCTRRCIFSFPKMYRKTLRNLAAVALSDKDLKIWSLEGDDFTMGDLDVLARRLADVANGHGMELAVCCGERWADPGLPIAMARCVDWPLLRSLLPRKTDVEVPRQPSREGCGCYKSTDIGRYETCRHGCLYCYAVDRLESAKRYWQRHDPDDIRL